MHCVSKCHPKNHPPKMDFRAYLTQHHAPSTAKRYEKEVKLFLGWLKIKNNFGYSEIIEYLNEQRKRYENVAPTLHAIQKYCHYLCQHQGRKNNPSSSIKLRDKARGDIQLQDLFTSEELEQLLKRKERYSLLKNRNQIIIGLLIYQGLTNGEICRLEVSDINLEDGTVYIKSTPKSNGRTLKLKSNQVLPLFKYLQEDRPKLLRTETQKLLISKLGKVENGEGISYLIERARHRFKDRKLNPKTIRQSVIANLLKSGKDLRLVQVFAGHKYPSTTERYRQKNLANLKVEVLKHHPLDN